MALSDKSDLQPLPLPGISYWCLPAILTGGGLLGCVASEAADWISLIVVIPFAAVIVLPVFIRFVQLWLNVSNSSPGLPTVDHVGLFLLRTVCLLAVPTALRTRYRWSPFYYTAVSRWDSA